ncbi:YdeI/OmpD-associated family protein [Rhizobium lusitanum]|uniref:Uncharacterized protein YdeI (YjbR/CyaY-like superfamily) n=1 Tax=Rhizobium lusitanum TaxID=293958 RepID=A0A7X0MFB9_9HYPH|nr:hypothetical protein [Rhizobium lusitanum]MBB6486955.1 uncharacterized protein YdeI (YjbR/CyaY-like superfamily) [Rhizobium lusitanum]
MSGYLAFADRLEIDRWLEANHATAAELQVRIYKKGTGVSSIDWNGCVIACLSWGWIDGHKKGLDEQSYIQRVTPRRPNSNWSVRNINIAEQLIATGGMQSAGLAKVLEAQRSGRWR